MKNPVEAAGEEAAGEEAAGEEASASPAVGNIEDDIGDCTFRIHKAAGCNKAASVGDLDTGGELEVGLEAAVKWKVCKMSEADFVASGSSHSHAVYCTADTLEDFENSHNIHLKVEVELDVGSNSSGVDVHADVVGSS
mmetsp:Transcript_31651/g.61989  ORF Transcript_31651/g.61989 Transcript_31651/m.61989 type:complete len:138 (-) Transcript_31651:178-591(-)